MVPIKKGAQSDAAESISRANLKKIDPTLRSKPEARQLNVGNAIQSFDDDGVYLQADVRSGSDNDEMKFDKGSGSHRS